MKCNDITLSKNLIYFTFVPLYDYNDLYLPLAEIKQKKITKESEKILSRTLRKH